MKRLAGLLRDQRGMETVEWAVMAAVLAAGTILAIGAVGNVSATRILSLVHVF